MKLINTKANHNKIKQTNLGKYRYFGQLIILFLCLTFIKTSFSIDVEDIAEFGSSKCEPVDSGFFFYKGKYIDAPYIVERRGLDVYINDILIRPAPKNALYDYSVDTDPGEPPPGISPFDPPPGGTDPKDNYYSKKWRYLYSHYDYDTAKKMMFETYNKCSEFSNVLWSGSESIKVVDKKTGKEIEISLSLQNGGRAVNQPTKNDFIKKMENIKNLYEKSLQNDISFFEHEGFSLALSGSKALNTIKIISSDANDYEKFRKLDEKKLISGCQKQLPWIVTDFEASSQLKERLDSLEKKKITQNITDHASNILNSNVFAPTLNLSNLEEKTKKSPNNVTVSKGQADNFPYNLSPVVNNIKTISQIENSSNKSKRIIIISLLSFGIITLLAQYVYRRMHIKSGKEGE